MYRQEAGSGYDQTIPLNDHLVGPLDIDLLRQCLTYIVRRHEILRTTFGDRNGQPVQIIHAAVPVEMPVFDLSGESAPDEKAREIIAQETSGVADLVVGPLIRFSLIRFGLHCHRLLRPCHHIIWDPGSTRILLRELSSLYQARIDGKPYPLSEFAPFQFADYAVWERTTALNTAAFREDIHWWAEHISWTRKFRWGPRPSLPRLPFERPRPKAAVGIEDSRVIVTVEHDLASSMDQLRRTEGTTFYNIWLAAAAALLARESGTNDVVVGTYVTTRRRAETRSLLGFCSNLLTLRLRCDLSRSFREWLTAVRDEFAEVDQRSYIPYEKLREELSVLRVRPLPIRFIFDAPLGFAREELHFGGLKMISAGEPRPDEMPWGFSMILDRRDGVQTLWAKFDARIHDPTQVRRFLNRLLTFLKELQADLDAPLARVIKRTA